MPTTTVETLNTDAAKTNAPRFRRLKRVTKLGAVLVLVLAGWVAYDLTSPGRTSIHDFDADEVARLDTAMWRSLHSAVNSPSR